jgi:arabinofuranosyltransferase
MGHRFWQVVSPAGVAVAAGFFYLVYEARAGALGFPLDDAWIHLQFARNLSQGDGFSFNAGQAAAGSTAPLWTLLLALLHAVWADPILPVKILGIALHGLSAGLSAWLARLVGLGRWAIWLAALGVALTPRLLWGSVSGMEIPLYTALATAGVALHLAGWRVQEHKGFALGVAACFALATLTRPECLLLLPLALADRWRRDQAAGWYWSGIGVFAVLLAPSVWFNLATIGKPLPNTFYAKVGSFGLLGALAGGDWGRVVKVLAYYPLLQIEEMGRFAVENSALLAVCVPLGGLYMLRAARRDMPLPWLIPLAVVAYPVVRGILAPFKGPTFQHGRYAAHLVPLLCVMAGAGLEQALVWLREGRKSPVSLRLLNWSGLAFAALVGLGLAGQNLRYAAIQAENVANINQMHVEMGRWLAQNTPVGARIATHDIGALGYYSGRHIIDTAGLVTPQVLNYLTPGMAADSGVLAFLQQERPDYLVIIPSWYPQLAQERAYFTPIHEVVLAHNTIAAGDRMVVFKADF